MKCIRKLICLDSSYQINYTKEILAGIINFMAIAYIIIVNPIIMNADGKLFPIQATITATILTIIIMSTIAGFVIKLPFVIAPGMGMNAMLSYTIILHNHMPINIALGVVFWSSLLLVCLSVTSIRQKIIIAIPPSIQIALSVGIGLFLALLGIKNANIIIVNPDTLLTLNKINLPMILTFCGFIVTCVLFIKNKSYVFILPMVLVSFVDILADHQPLPNQFLQKPDFSLFLHADLIHSFKLSILPAILSLFIVNFFDATSSAIGLLNQVPFTDHNLKNNYFKRSLITDAVGGVISSGLGTSPGTIFVESAAALRSGANTGIPSLVTALISIPCLFLSPLIKIIPSFATSPVLILVGILMMNHIRKIRINQLEDFIAVIITVIMMPLTFSITTGATLGILTYTILKMLLGKFDQINYMLILVSVCCAGWIYWH